MRHRGKNRWVPGTNNSVSDYSGQKFKASEMRMTWDNNFVHVSEWEPKHPQLIIHPRKENIAVRLTRTQNTPTELLDPPIDTGQMV